MKSNPPWHCDRSGTAGPKAPSLQVIEWFDSDISSMFQGSRNSERQKMWPVNPAQMDGTDESRSARQCGLLTAQALELHRLCEEESAHVGRSLAALKQLGCFSGAPRAQYTP